MPRSMEAAHCFAEGVERLVQIAPGPGRHPEEPSPCTAREVVIRSGERHGRARVLDRGVDVAARLGCGGAVHGDRGWDVTQLVAWVCLLRQGGLGGSQPPVDTVEVPRDQPGPRLGGCE